MRKVGLAFLTILMTVLFLNLSVVTHWADSELWSLSLAKTFLQHVDASSDYKVIFNLFLLPIYYFDFSNTETILVARLFFAVNGLLIAILTSFISKALFKDSEKAWICALILICNSFFLSQGFRIRSDLLACTFQLAGLLWFLHWVKNRRFLFLGVLLHICLLLCTPKAIYHLLVNLVFFFFYIRETTQFRWTRTQILSFLGILFPILALIVDFKYKALQSAFEYYLKSFQQTQDHPEYFSLQSFFFVFRFLKENILFIFLWIYAFIKRKQMSSKAISSALLAANLVVLFFILFHNERLPFYMLSLIPLLVIYTSHILRPWIAALFLLPGMYFYQIYSAQNSNSLQKEAIHIMENYLQQYPNVNYFDGTAVLPRQNQIFQFPAPAHYGNEFEIQKAIRMSDLVFLGNRMIYYIGSVQKTFKEESFIHLGSGVYGRGKILIGVTGQDTFQIPKPCPYLYEGDNFNTTTIIKNWTPQMKTVTSKSAAVVCSDYAPIQLPAGKNFAQIFDFDPNY